MSTEVQTRAGEVLREIEQLANVRFLPIIGAIKGRYLVDTVREYHVNKVLEVGTLVGYSAILMASGLPEDGKVTTIEINPDSGALAQDNIRRAGYSTKIEIYIGDALNVIPEIEAEFDMVFLDAAKKDYLKYLQLCENKLRKDGIVFADNVKMFADAMSDYLDYVRNSGKYRSRFFDVGFDGVEISQKLF